MYDCIDLPFICGFGCEDWEDSVSADERVRRVLKQACDGAIILMHDAKENYKTVEAVDRIIPELQRQSYELVTVSELFRVKCVTPVCDGTPKIYSSVFQ